jgi:hypothetical protein
MNARPHARLGLAHWAAWAGASASAPRRAVVHLVGTSSKKAKVRRHSYLRTPPLLSLLLTLAVMRPN